MQVGDGRAREVGERGDGDDETVTWWGLVIKGCHATRNGLTNEIADHTDLTPSWFDILIRSGG
ncbi:hypothetical protein, partial [Streptomyces malaysiensis]|nr:hypothetical protein [Streptomyces samsunensis]